jgi:rare lipoprotein A
MKRLLVIPLLLCTLCGWAAQGTAHISRYARHFTGRKTARGVRYDPRKRTAASRTLPFGSCVRLVNRAGGYMTVVKINDRGPWLRRRKFDVSDAAAHDLHMSSLAKVSYQTVPCS